MRKEYTNKETCSFIAIWLAALLISWFPATAEQTETKSEREPFEIVILPDTQLYTRDHPEIYHAQTEWIRDSVDKRNIRYVIHVGDLVQGPDNRNHWEVADAAMRKLEGHVPYTVVPGNHELPMTRVDGERRRSRDMVLFNEFFPPERFQTMRGYGGHRGEDFASNYSFFEAGGMKFLVIGLEFRPRPEALEWAGKIAEAHPDHRVIVNTHWYMFRDGTRDARPGIYVKGASGEEIWQEFVRQHENIFLVVSGHIGGSCHLTSQNDAGKPVHQILTDFQHLENGGNGYLRTLRFVPDKNRIEVESFSPWLDGKTWDGGEANWTLPYDMSLTAQDRADIIQKNESRTGKFRVVWTSDPTTSATIVWDQEEGTPAQVHYGKTDFQRRPDQYEHKVKPQRVQVYDGMTNCFARLENLKPDTEYFFCLGDESGVGPRLKFRTAPREPKAFTFIAGGDSRNFRDVRVEANRLCEKLRPLFVSFTGDMINQDEPDEWVDWLDDWQEMIGEDGNVIPIVPHRGNHERRPETIPNFFDTPDDAYFAFGIGGELFRYYALNSQIPAIGDQEQWLEKDLAKHGKSVIHLVAGYHKPMRPHVSKKSEGNNSMEWADNFYAHGFDLVLESDSHVMKRTQPLKPDESGPEGFSAAPDDPSATVYIGEGCWGAPLRPADDAKPWTLDTESFNGFDWIRVSPEGIEIKTVRIENAAGVEPVDPGEPFKTPEGLKLWEAKGGTVLKIPADS